MRALKIVAITAGTAVYASYLFFWLGWFSYTSSPPWIGVNSRAQFTLIAVLSVPLIAPIVIGLMVRKMGAKPTAFAVLPIAFLVLASYTLGSFGYYYSRTHPFDPFVQKHAISPTVPVERTDAFRILTLGGSTTFRSAGTVEQTYPWKLGRLLNHRVEVINAGMDWYTTRHSLINYTTFYRQWKPDLVIVMHAINDLYRSFSPPRFAVGPYNDLYSHFYGPSINGARPIPIETFLIDTLRPPMQEWYGDLRIHPVEMPLERFTSLAAFERNLASLVHYIQSDGSQVILMSQPSLYREDLRDFELKELWMTGRYMVEDVSVFRREIPSAKSMTRAMAAFNHAAQDIAERACVHFLDAAPRIDKNLDMFEDDVHYTDAGSTRLAEIVRHFLIESALIPAAARTARPPDSDSFLPKAP